MNDDLVVSEVFGPTFQGEGPTLGHRAAFVRLGRCNLDCSWCDTPYTWDWNRFDPAVELTSRSVDDVIAEVAAMGVERVVVTGGEPLLQQRRLVPFLDVCVARAWAVEIETNGTIVPRADVVERVERFTISPKLASSGVAASKAIVPDALAAFAKLPRGKAAFKFVAVDPGDLDEIQALVDEHGIEPSSVFVMPEGTSPDTLLARARVLADTVSQRGWNLTTRLHVLLWGDERGR